MLLEPANSSTVPKAQRFPVSTRRRVTSSLFALNSDDISVTADCQTCPGLFTGGLLKNDYLPYNEAKCQRSSGVEQRFRKPLVEGSIPPAGFIP